jgi:uncharacterized protein (DUF433 family)
MQEIQQKSDYRQTIRCLYRPSSLLYDLPLLEQFIGCRRQGKTMSKEYVELKEGAYRVGGTRVSLDSVVYGFQSGASLERIQQSYPALTLEQVYGAIAYYLANQETIDQYLIEGEKEFEKFQQASREKYPEWYEKMEKARKALMASQS